jgi:hypothetical protein
MAITLPKLTLSLTLKTRIQTLKVDTNQHLLLTLRLTMTLALMLLQPPQIDPYSDVSEKVD